MTLVMGVSVGMIFGLWPETFALQMAVASRQQTARELRIDLGNSWLFPMSYAFARAGGAENSQARRLLINIAEDRATALLLALCRAGHAVEEAAIFLFLGRLLRLDLLLGSLQISR